MILAYLGLVIFVLVCGIAIGATVVRDWLDGIGLGARRVVKPKPAPEPKPEPLPRMWVERLAELNTPTIKRRQRMAVIDVVGLER